jgi:hypothetical protein
MKQPILMNRSRLQVSDPTPFWFPRRTGAAFRRRSISFQFPVCATPSARAWRSRSTELPPNPAGELGHRLHQASPEGCQKNCVLKPQATGSTPSRHHRKEPISDSPALRQARWRSGGSVFAPHQHPAPPGLSGLCQPAHHQGCPNVDALRITKC